MAKQNVVRRVETPAGLPRANSDPGPATGDKGGPKLRGRHDVKAALYAPFLWVL
jgi:hypothetical protein